MHVANVRTTTSPSPGPLLVVAGEHLADQPERQKLDPDDDEQHAEQEKRPASDRRTSDLVDRQIGEDRASGNGRAQPDP